MIYVISDILTLIMSMSLSYAVDSHNKKGTDTNGRFKSKALLSER